MSTVSGTTLGAELRASFVPRLDRLGAHVGVGCFHHNAGCDGGQEIQTVFVSCSREAWVNEFGEPENVRRSFDVQSGQWRHSWEHAMPDGRVCCVGDIFERSSGRAWIIVRRFSAADAVEAA